MDNFFKIRRKKIIICLFLVAASLVVYLQLINCDFVNYDDNSYVTENPYIKAGLTLESFIWAFTTGHASNWHPLTWLSHMLDCELYGLNPMGHHWTNLQIHIVNTVLLFILLNWMTGAVWPSSLVAALFALHPLHVESVTWVAERKDVLCALFWILSILAYVRYTRNRSKMNYLLLVVLFSFGLMSKPMIVTLPFTLLLLDFWPLSRFQSMVHEQQAPKSQMLITLVWEKIPLFILSAMSSILTLFVQQYGGAVTSIETISLKARIANAIVSYTNYIEKMIWPLDLAVLYPLREWRPGQVIMSGLFLLVLSVLAVRSWRRFPYLTIGWLWYLGTLVPVIGLVQVGAQRMADRYTYIPLIGLFIIVAWGAQDIAAKWRSQRVLLLMFSSLVLIFFMICTWFQVSYWQDGITLFKHAVKMTDNNSIAHCVLGHSLDIQGKHKEAILHYSKALQINPMYTEAHNSLGVLFASKGNFNDAFYHYKEALRINPKYSGAYYNLGKIYANKGEIKDAILYYKKALQVSQNMTEALYNLSWIAATAKDDKFRNGIEAVKLAEKLCKFQNYSQPLSLDALAAAYAEAGRFKEAILTAQKGLELALKMGPKELALGLENRLKLYHTGRPYRQNSHK